METGTRIEAGRLRHLAILGLPVVILIGIALLSYPRSVSFSDEASYLGQAWTFREGRLFPSELGARLVNDRPAVDGNRASYFPPGMPLILAPVVSTSTWPASIALGLASLILLWIAAVAVCRSLEISDFWSWAWLLYPPFILYSRTVMSDMPTVAGSLGVLALLLRRRPLPAGSLLGLLIWIRVGNFAIAALFIAAALAADLRARRAVKSWSSLRLAAPVLIAAAILAAYSLFAFGSPVGLAQGYGSAGFSLNGMAGRLAFYLLCLALVYPLMLIGPFLRSGESSEVNWYCGLVGFGVVLFYSAYTWLVTTPLAGGVSGVGALVARPLYGMRFVLPAAALFMVPYCAWLDRLVRSRVDRRLLSTLVTVATLALLVAAAVIAREHYRYTQRSARLRDAVVEHLPAEATLAVTKKASRFASPVWGIPRAAPVEEGEAVMRLRDPSPVDGAPGKASLAILEIGADEREGAIIGDLRSRYRMTGVDVDGGTLWLEGGAARIDGVTPTEPAN